LGTELVFLPLYIIELHNFVKCFTHTAFLLRHGVGVGHKAGHATSRTGHTPTRQATQAKASRKEFKLTWTSRLRAQSKATLFFTLLITIPRFRQAGYVHSWAPFQRKVRISSNKLGFIIAEPALALRTLLDNVGPTRGALVAASEVPLIRPNGIPG
jgi:hypothetical protein